MDGRGIFEGNDVALLKQARYLQQIVNQYEGSFSMGDQLFVWAISDVYTSRIEVNPSCS